MNNKNRKKVKISDAIAEAILEIILTLIFCAIGFIICLGLGKTFSIQMNDFDSDSLGLIGIISLIVIVTLISSIKAVIKKIKAKNKFK